MGGDPLAFARAVVGEVVRSEKSRTVLLHGSMDSNTPPSEIEAFVKPLDGGMSTNRCVVVHGMEMPVAPFHWQEQSKALQFVLRIRAGLSLRPAASL